jgi:hypothetical protein
MLAISIGPAKSEFRLISEEQICGRQYIGYQTIKVVEFFHFTVFGIRFDKATDYG